MNARLPKRRMPAARKASSPLQPVRRSRLRELARALGTGEGIHKKISSMLDLGLRGRLEALVGQDGLSSLTFLERVRYRLLQGDAAGALLLMREVAGLAESGRRFPDSDLSALATLAARMEPQLGWRLMTRCKKVPSCAAAIALEAGIDPRTQAGLLESCSDRAPDALLLRANIATFPGEKLTLFNQYLGRHGLAEVTAADGDAPFTLANLRGRSASLGTIGPGTPLLSVLVAGRNVEDCVEFSIRSILGQTHSKLEVIFVDDASSDGTLDRVKHLASEDSRVRIVPLDENVGTYAAKNAAIELASGDLIAFHDADDWSHPDKYKLAVDALLTDPNLVAVTSCYVRLTETGRFTSHVTWPLKRWSPNSVVFRRHEVLTRIGYLDSSRFGADSEFVARIRWVFGEERHLKLDLPLALALDRPGSLMNAPDTGLGAGGFSRARSEYQEMWTEWHLHFAINGLVPYLAPGQRIADLATSSAKAQAAGETVLVCSKGIARIPFIDQFLSAPVVVGKQPRAPAKVAGWGRKASGLKAAICAQQLGCPALYLEDGFLRSFETGARCPPLSVVLDDVGIYYDSTRPSALENLLQSETNPLAGIAGEVARARGLILRHRLSKYNAAPDWEIGDKAGLPSRKTHRRVLVVDQTAGDLSVALGGASAATFSAMLAAARVENPDATIFVKTHPEVSAGRKSGYLTQVQDDEQTVVLRQSINPLSLIEHMDRVYVVSSTMGFEALLAGKPVTCFGLPWYAGWGATDDRQKAPRRTRRRSVEELFAAAYFHYTRYLDPVTHGRGTIFDVIDWLARQRAMAAGTAGRLICVGFRRWKAANLKPMLSLAPSRVVFVPTASAAAQVRPALGDSLVFWGATPPPGVAELVTESGARALRMEDGFVRSVGLGSDLIRPLSLVFDGTGIYFDPTRPSELERLLETATFSPIELQRAREARAFIVAHGITKYNLEPRANANWSTGGRRVLLVPGQVEDDASIRLGCTDVKTNLGLLQATRAAHPDAYIVYKPHPDVMSGNRAGVLALQQVRRLADQIETHLSVVSCIDACDEVHTMTSLTGFDALLRGKRVVTYGQPFYAGWGLTDDRVQGGIAWSRRTRKLTLDELVAGALLRYPVYWDWDLKGYTTCEAVLRRIVERRQVLEADGGLEQLRTGFLRRQWRKANVLARAWLGRW